MLRASFGLTGLLICALIVAYVWSTYTQKTVETGQQMTKEAQQLSGHSEDGTPAAKSIKTVPEQVGGRLKDLLVTEVVPGGAMDKYYGLQKGDKITTVGAWSVDMNDDAEMAQDMLLDSYEKHQPVIVIRNGQRITLPVSANVDNATAAGANPTAPTPAATPSANPTPAVGDHSVRDQVNRILNTPAPQ